MSAPRPRRVLKKVSMLGQTLAKRPSVTVTPSCVPKLHMAGTFRAAVGTSSVGSLPSSRGVSLGAPDRNHTQAIRSGWSISIVPTQVPPPLCPHKAHGIVFSSGCLVWTLSSSSARKNVSLEPCRGSHHSWQSPFSGCSYEGPSKAHWCLRANACQCQSKAAVWPARHAPSPQPC